MSPQWIIQLMEGIHAELQGAAKADFSALTSLHLQSEIHCYNCPGTSIGQPTHLNCLSLPLVCFCIGFKNQLISITFFLLPHIFLKVYNESTGHRKAPKKLSEHITHFFSDVPHPDWKHDIDVCKGVGGNETFAIKKLPQVIITKICFFLKCF